ncbi:MAG: DUF2786 domain-containing protein [Deltaproteobacteria bacterium]|nr:MAG: DUF2786 domain-containing protein [Deltaproteobacteria bacterium]
MDQAILDRVRKLLGVATSNNVHEAAAAAARAQRLIAEHRLEAWLAAETEEVDPIVDARDAPLETARRLRKWKVVLAGAIAQANGCVAYTLKSGKESSIVLVGRERDREVVHALWDWLLKRIEWLSATEGQGQPREWHESFRIGAADTIGRRLQEQTREVATQAPAAALVRVDAAMEAHQAALDHFVADKLRLGKGRNIRVWMDAYESGKASAKHLPLPEEPQ